MKEVSGCMKALRNEVRRESQGLMAEAGIIDCQSISFANVQEDISSGRHLPTSVQAAGIGSTDVVPTAAGGATSTGGHVIVRLDAKVDNLKDRVEALSNALICIKVLEAFAFVLQYDYRVSLYFLV